MKRYSLLQVIILFVVALIAGFLAGIAVHGYFKDPGNLAGTIGKSDSFRNIRITQDDISLRNELVSDTSKAGQYQRYLLCFYLESPKLVENMKLALAKTGSVPEFEKIRNQYSLSSRSLGIELEPARADIVRALNLLKTLDASENMPLIDYLNDAQKAIFRIRAFENMVFNYMEDLADFISNHPEKTGNEMKEAYNLLANETRQDGKNAIYRPELNYRGQKILLEE